MSDPAHVLTDEDRTRVSLQSGRILALLKAGPVTTSELAAVALKYSSRISDLREDGWIIQCRRGDGGNNVYALLGRRSESTLQAAACADCEVLRAENRRLRGLCMEATQALDKALPWLPALAAPRAAEDLLLRLKAVAPPATAGG